MVADYYLDARGSGFDLQSWTRLRDKYLAHPLPTHDAAYRCSAALRLQLSQPHREAELPLHICLTSGCACDSMVSSGLIATSLRAQYCPAWEQRHQRDCSRGCLKSNSKPLEAHEHTKHNDLRRLGPLGAEPSARCWRTA